MYFPHPEWQVGVSVSVDSFTCHTPAQTRTDFRAYAYNKDLPTEAQHVNADSRVSLEMAVALCIASRSPVSIEVMVNPRAEKFASEVPT
jgi:hypothetical protein